MKRLHLHPLDIFPFKVQVERSNKQHLDQLVREENAVIEYRAPQLRVQKKEHVMFPDPADMERGNYLISKEGMKQLDDNYFAFFHLTICEGAQVMCRCNKYIDMGVCNGTLGIVLAVDANFISVLFVVNGKFLEKPMDIERVDFFASIGKTAEVVMTQFPLTLSWATTVHKVGFLFWSCLLLFIFSLFFPLFQCQGLTLDRVRIDASSMFCPGQLYVALSRVCQLEHFTLLGFHEKSLLHDPRVVDFENRQFQ